MIPCWSCGQAVSRESCFCESCRALQPLRPGIDHFAVLELPRIFALPPDMLEVAFKRLSRLIHPDRFALKSDRERRYSLEHSTALNDAQRTLRVPVKRAEYLLGLWGKPITEESGRPTGPGKGMPLEFLEEVLELREQIAEARFDGDQKVMETKLEEAHERWRSHYARIAALFSELERAQGEGLEGAAQDALLSELEREVLMLRYMHSMLSEHGVTPTHTRSA